MQCTISAKVYIDKEQKMKPVFYCPYRRISFVKALLLRSFPLIARICYSQFWCTCRSNKTVLIKHDTGTLKLFLRAAEKNVLLLCLGIRNCGIVIFSLGGEICIVKFETWIVYPESQYVNSIPELGLIIKLPGREIGLLLELKTVFFLSTIYLRHTYHFICWLAQRTVLM